MHLSPDPNNAEWSESGEPDMGMPLEAVGISDGKQHILTGGGKRTRPEVALNDDVWQTNSRTWLDDWDIYQGTAAAQTRMYVLSLESTESQI